MKSMMGILWDWLGWRTSFANTAVAAVGCLSFADTFHQAVGLWFICEAFLMTIENCWSPKLRETD